MGKLALEIDSRIRAELTDRFGKEINDPDGNINRSKLAAAAFATPDGQRDLTRITFPSLYRLASDHIHKLSSRHEVVVFDAALIYEWGVENDFDKIVVVTASRDKLIERAVLRLGIDQQEATRRLDSQIPPEEKARRSDHLIINDGDIDMLKHRAEIVWKEITAQKG